MYKNFLYICLIPITLFDIFYLKIIMINKSNCVNILHINKILIVIVFFI